jgi:hypothetical protein
MTWVVGGNCFNGFVCVADIQATISYPKQERRPEQYFNCVQKIHKITKNLCVAFSGDIRSGLKIINELRLYVANYLKDDEYFDIDGQSLAVRSFLKWAYRQINPGIESPSLHLLFLWNSQDGDGLIFKPFCMKFRSPEFNMTSVPIPGLLQLGSGSADPKYKAIAAFLSGDDAQTPEYNAIFDSENIPGIWTVSKFKNLLFHEGANVSLPGVSKTLMSFESVIPYSELFSEAMHEKLTAAFKVLGVQYSTKKTANHSYNEVVIDPQKIKNTVRDLMGEDFEAAVRASDILSEGMQQVDMSVLYELPPITVDYIWGEEVVHSPHLITTWEGMVKFLKVHNIDMKACVASA